MPRRHFRIRVTGRVQGVAFRASTVVAARERAINGFVRNESDGSVYIEAEGEETSLAEFVNWCHIGPPAARVDHCEVADGQWRGYPTFEIHRT